MTDFEQPPILQQDLPTTKPTTNRASFFAILLLIFSLIIGSLFIYSSLQKNKSIPLQIESDPIQQNKLHPTTEKTEQKSDVSPGIPSSTIVDTNQTNCFNTKTTIPCGTSFSGQDAQYQGTAPSYQDNKDGTVTDLNTNLMWIQNPGDKTTHPKATASADSFSYAGYNDWRVPSIKELYSLMDFSGIDPDARKTSSTGLTPFIDTDFFNFEYGDTSNGDRIIDSQWITSTVYVSTVMNNQECFFGVNFADGRIKCYPTNNPRNNGYFIRYVRGAEYGSNDLVTNESNTVSDKASGLMWQKNDSGTALSWENSLQYCEDLKLANHIDWRVPNTKELLSIVDYSRSPDTTNSPAIDPIFTTSSITNEAGQKDYPFFWTSTTHSSDHSSGGSAVYIAFGRALGEMRNDWMDVHGAGAQRSDPKAGDISEYPTSFGPQGDVRRLHNFVRCVR